MHSPSLVVGQLWWCPKAGTNERRTAGRTNDTFFTFRVNCTRSTRLSCRLLLRLPVLNGVHFLRLAVTCVKHRHSSDWTAQTRMEGAVGHTHRHESKRGQCQLHRKTRPRSRTPWKIALLLRRRCGELHSRCSQYDPHQPPGCRGIVHTSQTLNACSPRMPRSLFDPHWVVSPHHTRCTAILRNSEMLHHTADRSRSSSDTSTVPRGCTGAHCTPQGALRGRQFAGCRYR